MNNFCTNCGKKLNKDVIKCDECNTYIIDLKSVKKKKILIIISIIISILILGIIIFISCYNLYYKNLHKSLYNKYLKEDFNNAKYSGYDACRACGNSCDGSCIESPKIVGCFKYYYKSNPNIENPDIIVISNRGNIWVDTYSVIINKYGYTEENDEDFEYEVEKRSYLNIHVDDIKSDNIVKIYKMIDELIEIYKKDNRNNLYIRIEKKDGHNNTSFVVSNENTYDKSKFEWKFDNDVRLINPSLNDVKKIYEPFKKSSSSLYSGSVLND